MTNTSFNATVTNTLQFIQQQVNASMNTTAFTNYKISSVVLATLSSKNDPSSTGTNLIAIIVPSVIGVLFVLALGLFLLRWQNIQPFVKSVKVRNVREFTSEILIPRLNGAAVDDLEMRSANISSISYAPLKPEQEGDFYAKVPPKPLWTPMRDEQPKPQPQSFDGLHPLPSFDDL